jgi:hypothetical protein
MSKQKAIIPRRQVYLTLIDAPRAARRLTPVEGESFHQIGCGRVNTTQGHHMAWVRPVSYHGSEMDRTHRRLFFRGCGEVEKIM